MTQSAPKYHVGQLVAVCTPGLTVVLPATTVTARDYHMPHKFHNPETDEVGIAPEGWFYMVADCPYLATWLAEHYLRPINPDEYTEKEGTQCNASL